MVTVQIVANHMDMQYAAANRLVGDLTRMGVLEEITGLQRNRVFPATWRPFEREGDNTEIHVI